MRQQSYDQVELLLSEHPFHTVKSQTPLEAYTLCQT